MKVVLDDESKIFIMDVLQRSRKTAIRILPGMSC
jgi:hypothetical protein